MAGLEGRAGAYTSSLIWKTQSRKKGLNPRGFRKDGHGEMASQGAEELSIYYSLINTSI